MAIRIARGGALLACAVCESSWVRGGLLVWSVETSHPNEMLLATMSRVNNLLQRLAPGYLMPVFRIGLPIAGNSRLADRSMIGDGGKNLYGSPPAKAASLL
jgi:hypothetical protein